MYSSGNDLITSGLLGKLFASSQICIVLQTICIIVRENALCWDVMVPHGLMALIHQYPCFVVLLLFINPVYHTLF
jgi:hypothetical protein